ncbi:hypothetical protein [Desulfovibrio inopinatus]|uniref:hypothetical protein n=1 Tax=Desulfovibrio inopinatus TaxID=102109 RepID=UPI0003FC013C|nr:hypothetical protein [Desulfovibrio inopinatus]
MDPQIFNLGLSDDALSLYMILDHLHAFDMKATPEQFDDRWHKSKDEFDTATAELVMQRVVENDGHHLHLLPSSDWLAVKPD